MKNAFIIHGAYGTPEENWFPWLKEKLEQEGWKVTAQKFPTPENQILTNWEEVFKKHIGSIHKETIFIAHSLGPAFVLSILEKINKKIKGCFFVAGFFGKALGVPEVDEINKTFTDKDFNWNKIRNNCNYFELYASDNDPYVPLSRTKELTENVQGKLIIQHGARHFNKAAGYLKFPELLDSILKH